MKLKSKRSKKRKFCTEIQQNDIVHSGHCHSTETPMIRLIDHLIGQPTGYRECHHKGKSMSTSLHHNFPLHRRAHCLSSSTHLASTSSPFHGTSSQFYDNFPEEINTTSHRMSSHRGHGSRHRPRHRVWQSLLMVTLLCAQMVTVHAMLDALKALFILTGASTYLGECLV